MSILDLSKSLMYDFYYNRMKAQHGDRCQLIYTDTDSLLLEIQTEDVYRDIAEHAHLYDTSDYPKGHPLYSTVNKKVLGKMKDECAGRPIAEYVGLRPRKKHQEGKGREKECREETHPTRAVQRGSLRQEDLPPRHGRAAIRGPPHLRPAPEQGLVVPLRLQALDRKNGIDTLAYGNKDAVSAMDNYVAQLITG